jgi:hypothetical protein
MSGTDLANAVRKGTCAMRKRSIASALPLLAAAMLLPVAGAQQPPPTWTLHRALKVKPGKAAEFQKLYSTTVKRFHQARIDAGVETGWVLTKVVLPSGEEAPYHYTSNMSFREFPPLDPSREDLAPFIEKAGMTPETFLAALEDVASLVRTTVSARIETVGVIEAGDFVRVDYMKSTPGKVSDYVALERTVFKPLHEQRVKDGAISAWAFNAVALPGGSERAYDFFTINAVKKSGALGNMNAGYTAEKFAQALPNVNYVGTMNKTQELRTIVRSYVLRVMEVLR